MNIKELLRVSDGGEADVEEFRSRLASLVSRMDESGESSLSDSFKNSFRHSIQIELTKAAGGYWCTFTVNTPKDIYRTKGGIPATHSEEYQGRIVNSYEDLLRDTLRQR